MQVTCNRCTVTFEAHHGKWCIDCRKDIKNEGNRHAYHNNADVRTRKAQKDKEWRQANADSIRERMRRWDSENREKVRAYHLKYYYADPEKARRKREKQKLRQYGLTPEQYAEMLAKQGGVCAICHLVCSTGRKLAVDHDPETGRVRGLLCTNCNQGIGKFHDDIEKLQAAILYLQADLQAAGIIS